MNKLTLGNANLEVGLVAHAEKINKLDLTTCDEHNSSTVFTLTHKVYFKR